MIKAELVLMLLAEGVPARSREIADALGWDIDLTAKLMRGMWTRGLISENPKTYTITQKGVAKRMRINQPRTPKQAAAHERRQAKRLAEQQKPLDADSVVKAARSVANSVFAMGAR